MQLSNYKQCLVGTVQLYNSKLKEHIGEMFAKNKISCDGVQQVDMFDARPAVNVTDLKLEEQIARCLTESEKAICLFEDWEYEKDYRYSAVFTADDFETVKHAVEGIPTLEAEQNESERTVGYDAPEPLPVRRELEEQVMLKFCFVFSAVHPQSGEEMLLKYPVLVVLHQKHQLIEMRFDVLKQYFQTQQGFYSKLVQKIRAYLKEKLAVELVPLEMNFMKETANDEVKLIAEYMNMASGGRAVLEVGDNEEWVLPFIGELKSLIQEYHADLEKVPALEDALNQFVYEKSEMSEFPWIELLWPNEIKTRSVRAKFTFNYGNNGFGLIQHYYNAVLIGRERMYRVIEHISANRPRDC